MNTWVRKTLTAGALAAGALLFAPGGAAFASTGHSTTADTAKHSTVSSSASHWGPDRRHRSFGHDRFRSRSGCGDRFRFHGFGSNRGSRCWDDVDFDRFGGWGRHNGWQDDDFFGSDDYILCEDGVSRPSGNLGAGHHPAGGYGDVKPATHKPVHHKPAKPSVHKPAKPAGTAPVGTAPTGSAPAGSAPVGTAPAGQEPADNGYATTGGRKK
jgi:hypothetical protein